MNILQELEAGAVTTSPEETESLAFRLTRHVSANQVLALRGDLGTGKTTFVRGLARGLGIEKTITSPTYNIFTIYHGRLNLLHLDAWRIDDPAQYDELLLEEFLTPPFLLAIEWPEHVGNRLPHPDWTLNFTILENHHHRLTLLNPTRLS